MPDEDMTRKKVSHTYTWSCQSGGTGNTCYIKALQSSHRLVCLTFQALVPFLEGEHFNCLPLSGCTVHACQMSMFSDSPAVVLHHSLHWTAIINAPSAASCTLTELPKFLGRMSVTLGLYGSPLTVIMYGENSEAGDAGKTSEKL